MWIFNPGKLIISSMIGYPAQTSLIPIQVALAKFLENQGFLAAFGNYPYWYLGTTPFRFLTGPILPVICLTLHRVFSSLSLFEIVFLLIAACWMLGAVGVYLLVRELAPLRPAKRDYVRGTGNWVALLSAVFYLFGPIVPFLFRFSDGLYLIAFSFLPFTLLMYLRLLRRWKRKTAILCIILITFIILLDSLIIPSLVLGMGAVLLAQAGWKKVEEKLKRSLWFMAYGLLLATFWYTPGYWLTLLGAPSLAGKGLAGVIIWLGKLLPTALAFGIAIFSVKFFKKRNLLRDFCFYWLFIYVCLTLLRFLSDPDFWLDWMAYGIELQMGIGIALGVFFEDRRRKSEDGFRRQMTEGRQKISFQSSIFLALYFLLFTFVFNKYVLGTLQRDISQTVEYKIGSQLSKIAKSGERVFLSGTTAFWLNAFFDIPQVRGGKDEAAINQSWRKAVWEIREGTEPEKSVEWLKKLGVSYLVVHTDESEEYYHDFSHPEKFEGVEELEKVYDEGGDKIYKLED